MCGKEKAKKTPRERGVFVLLLRLLEGDVLAGLGIVLLELDLARDELLVLARPIHLTGRFVAQLDETILRHIDQIIGSSRLSKTREKGKHTGRIDIIPRISS